MSWQCYHNGRSFGAPRASRQTAQNLVDKPYLRGRASVQHVGTGEIYERRDGGWYPGDTARAPKAKAPAP